MKAIRVHQFGGPEQLKYEDVPDPAPKRGEVLVKIHATGVNPFETYMRTGTYAIKPQLPYTPGADGAGEVVAVGEGISAFKKGDRVYVGGGPMAATYAEKTACPITLVHRLPQNFSFEQGAAIGVPYTTAYRALFQKAHLLPGEIVLIHGASGGVGIAALQLARAAGATVVGTAGSAEGRELIMNNGAHHALDHNDPEMPQKLKKLTADQGVNVILEMLANKNLAQDLSMVRRRGRIVVIGNRGSIEINPRDAMAKDSTILGMAVFNSSQEELAQIQAALVAALETGIARPVIGQKFPLAEAARAHEAVLAGNSHGKIVLIP
jgi:NADPH2:quinone reductase